jgi:hypothetical protein
MNKIFFPVLDIRQVSPVAFVGFWERRYSGYDEDFYRENIGQSLTEKRIGEWFKWKNGRPLSDKKRKTIRRYLSPDEHITANADQDALTAFLSRPGGVIWRIFWLHLQHPKVFPIYDQHVHRAMAYLLEGSVREIPVAKRAKIRSYLGDYRPFFCRFKDCDQRLVDRALWSFGRFLTTKDARALGLVPEDQADKAKGLGGSTGPRRTGEGVT